jgi:hypothetical protein
MSNLHRTKINPDFFFGSHLFPLSQNEVSKSLAASLAGRVGAIHGKLDASEYIEPSPGYIYQCVYLTDSATGSTYTGSVYGGFNACTTSPFYIQ